MSRDKAAAYSNSAQMSVNHCRDIHSIIYGECTGLRHIYAGVIEY